METVIGLLMVLLPVIFKLIGKRLERASEGKPKVVNADDAPIEDWAETVRRHLEEQLGQTETYVQPVPEEAPAPVPEPEPERKVVHEPVVKKAGKRKPIKSKPILHEEVKKEREKIDTKKLIVYSEIMKPKYME